MCAARHGVRQCVLHGGTVCDTAGLLLPGVLRIPGVGQMQANRRDSHIAADWHCGPHVHNVRVWRPCSLARSVGLLCMQCCPLLHGKLHLAVDRKQLWCGWQARLMCSPTMECCFDR